MHALTEGIRESLPACLPACQDTFISTGAAVIHTIRTCWPSGLEASYTSARGSMAVPVTIGHAVRSRRTLLDDLIEGTCDWSSMRLVQMLQLYVQLYGL